MLLEAGTTEQADDLVNLAPTVSDMTELMIKTTPINPNYIE
jgi:hypothetical protein